MNKTGTKRALFSLFDQENAVTYARELVSLGWDIIATKETFDLFRKENIPVTDISEFLGVEDNYPFPPTLHPLLELVLTTDKGKTIDSVYIMTYPLSEGNDVGGHTILGLAAKGKRIPVTSKEDMEEVIQDLRLNNNEISPLLLQKLINKANTKIIKHYLSLLGKNRPLLEGENPYQTPSDLFQLDYADGLALSNFQQISGSLPCYTNMADFDCILTMMCLLTEAFFKYYQKVPNIVIAAKHGNACGLAIDWSSPVTTIENALLGNPIAIFGGEVIVNFSINESLAQSLVSNKKREGLLGNSKWGLDLLIVPELERAAAEILGNQKRLKIFKNENLKNPYFNKTGWSYRMVRGGFLRQPPHNYVLDLAESKAEFPLPESNYLDSLIIAWATAWTSSHGGNEVAIVKDRMLLGAGGGPSTIDACYAAIERAKKYDRNLRNSVFAADAFFPFTDAPDGLVKIGCVYGIVPAGGKNFESVKNCFNKHNVKVFYLPEQFRGFCRH